MPAPRTRQRRPMHPRSQAAPATPRLATIPGAATRDPLEWLAARLPVPFLLLTLPFVVVGLVAVGVYGGLRTRPWDTAFGLSGWGAFVWLVLAYLGIA